ncbi:TolC family protein [Persicobacter psychrovividus]|uniref:TolC family protein n=1 Tax=Persicobacter psychrovividus TaxID=387638 RepID=A0ABN6L8K9_9BACT|nr:hypothetical protein PEPS_16260 [Persicobacter psychrovividus]
MISSLFSEQSLLFFKVKTFKFLLFTFLFISSSPIQAQDVEIFNNRIFESLPNRETLIDSAQYHSPLLEAQKVEIERMELELRLNRHDIWKDFRLFNQAFYTNSSAVVYNDISTGGGTSVPTDARQSGYQGRVLFGINFQFSLIDLIDRPKQLKKDHLELQLSNLEYQGKITEVRTKLMKQYFSLAKAQIQLKKTIREEGQLDYLFKKSKNDFDAGLIELGELLEQEAKLEQVRVNLEQDKINVLMEYLILEEFAGIPLSNFYD